MNKLDYIKQNLDPKVIISGIAALAVFGAITYAAVRSGVAPLKTVANVANGGK